MSNDTEQDYYGTCPHRGKTDGYVNIGRDHWFFCQAHRVKWCAGSNLFSGWQEETHEAWQANAKRLAGFAVLPSRPIKEVPVTDGLVIPNDIPF